MPTCRHCHGDTAISNPSGFCSHVHYPDACDICEKLVLAEKCYTAGFEASGEGYNGEWWGKNGQKNFDIALAKFLDDLRGHL